jgi:prepilin-type N-terminal cleavage/methylation domain-containing protein
MKRGFSLIELLVVIGIFIVITSVILANNSKFNSSVLLGNMAYDIALSIREAQVYGLSTQVYSNQFSVGYGIHFQGNNTYVLFADRNSPPNKRYESATDGIVQTYTVGRGNVIKNYCGIKTDGTKECSDNAAAITHLDIGFLRPNPDSTITGDSASAYSSGTITVVGQSGETRTISIQSTGQISVTNP